MSDIEHRDGYSKGRFKVLNKYGIHARPAALLVKTANKFDAEITVEKDGNCVSGRSIMGLMSLEAGCGAVLDVVAEGVDAREALEQIEDLIVKRRFDEDEE